MGPIIVLKGRGCEFAFYIMPSGWNWSPYILKTQWYLHSIRLACWWPGDAKRPDNSRHNVEHGFSYNFGSHMKKGLLDESPYSHTFWIERFYASVYFDICRCGILLPKSSPRYTKQCLRQINESLSLRTVCSCHECQCQFIIQTVRWTRHGNSGWKHS